MLFAIGAGPQVVAVSSYDEFPPEVKSLPRVGALLDPGHGAHPRAAARSRRSSTGRRPICRRSSRARGFASSTTGTPGWPECSTRLRTWAPRSAGPAEGERLAREIRGRLDAIQARVRGRPKPRTLLVFERDPASLRGVYVSGGVGFLHDMLGIAGGVNVFADVAARVGAAVGRDDARAGTGRDPRSSRDGTARGDRCRRGEARLGNARVVPAVQQGRIQILNGEHLVVPGPRVVQGTEAFARALHPDAFK